MANKPKTKEFQRKSEVLTLPSKIKTVTLTLPQAHTKQDELINAFETHNVRFIVGACGTKFGKTFGCAIRLVKEAWENPNTLNWWVAPTHPQAVNALNLIKKLLPDGMYVEYKADYRLDILNPDGTVRSAIQFKSADNPASLRGYAVNFFILDEAAIVVYESFVSVMTTVTQTMGRGIIISTPKGRGWFYDVYQRGEKLFDDGTKRYANSEDDPWREWYSIRMPTWVNPYVPQESIRQARKNLPRDVFEQEYSARFLSESAGVFRGIKECTKGTLEKPIEGHTYVIGVDLARLRDFTVLTVVDKARRHLVAWERFNQVEWSFQYAKIKALADAYNHALVKADSTGIGDPIVDALKNGGLNVSPYKIGNNIAKQQLIEKLRVDIEKGRITFPADCVVLIDELQRFEYNISDSGTVRYSAPEGFYDDCVISLALANLELGSEPFKYKYSQRRGL